MTERMISRELAGLEQPLSHFRDAMRRWSEHAQAAQQQAEGMRGFLYDGGRRATRAGVSSLLIHAAAFATVLSLTQSVEVTHELKSLAPTFVVYAPKPHTDSGGGGGGGAREPLPASRGNLPKATSRIYTPPRVTPVEAQLIMPPSITTENVMPNVSGPYGDPFSTALVPSNGPGSGGGIGTGRNGGVGQGDGPGAGPGSNGLGGGITGVFRPGGGVTLPVLVRQVEPEYSEEARKAKWQGEVLLSVVVDERGRVRDIRVLRSAGLGLDERAIEAVRQWLFKPGTLRGQPVPVEATVAVNFRLL